MEVDDTGAIIAPSDEDCGPAMRACTENERKFIVALVERGARNRTQAAMMLGNYATRESAQVVAHRWFHSERVQLALKEWTQKALEGDVYLARRALREIISDPMHKDRFKAVQELFNRNGMLVETITRHVVEDNRATKDIIRTAIDYARSLGDERLAYKLLGPSYKKEAIDAEFVEIDGSEGLEDLL